MLVQVNAEVDAGLNVTAISTLVTSSQEPLCVSLSDLQEPVCIFLKRATVGKLPARVEGEVSLIPLVTV